MQYENELVDQSVARHLPRLLGRTSDSAASAAEQHQQRRTSSLPQEDSGKGPVSILQEFVQCSKEFRFPPKRPVLQWSYATRMAGVSALAFQATVSFLLNGIPHHCASAWHACKKKAQRDAAERTLAFFVGSWGETLLSSVEEEEAATATTRGDALIKTSRSCGVSHETLRLLMCISEGEACDVKPLNWQFRHEQNGSLYAAQLEFPVLGVLHKFCGEARASQEEARLETARRVLWYLQIPGFDIAFEPNAAAAAALNPPPSHWASNASEEDALQLAERKTILMRVQNRLQQALSKDLAPGQGVWDWSFEEDHQAGGWPVLCRATVRVPSLGVEFTGNWTRGQRAAQNEACSHVVRLLDRMG